MMRAASIVLCTLVVFSAPAATLLFPTPLHITRQVHEPISGQTTVLNEYAYGNRLITVRGTKTAIADYEKGELIEIDRETATYSITRFDALAKLAERTTPQRSAARERAPVALKSTPATPTKSGRVAEFFEASVDSQQAVVIGVDRSVTLSLEALEVLIGSAYPAVRRPDHEVALSASAGRLPAASQSTGASAGSQQSYALPIEIVVRHVIEGNEVELRNSVLRVGNELPPADLMSIPAGARLVESRTVAVNRELDRVEGRGEPVPKP